jgi:hypothetical protein
VFGRRGREDTVMAQPIDQGAPRVLGGRGHIARRRLL